MKHWKETYFDNKVEVRKVGETQFMNVESVVFEDINE
jgi:CD2 antigen cytoplasmic tail-binding protein 2